MATNLNTKEDLISYLKEKYPNNPERWQEQHCSFCGIGSNSAKGLVAGPQGVRICNECVLFAHQVLKEGGKL